MVRKTIEIIEDYREWAFRKTENSFYNKEIFYTSVERDQSINNGRAIAEILELSYKPVVGIYWFHKFILGDMMYAGHPTAIHFNKLWLDWSKIASSGDHISLVSSRQVGKSTYFSCILPVYRTTLYQNYNILIESASEDQATKILSRITTLINNNEFLSDKKDKTGKWSSTEIAYNNCMIIAKGVGSEVRGGTFDLILCDDIIRSDNKLSDSDIERFVDEELEPMIFIRKGQIIIVGTKMSPTDIFSTVEERIEEGGEWNIHYFPAILDWDTKTLLCPDRFTWNQLMRKRAVMGKLKFKKEFLCSAITTGTQLFDQDTLDVAKAQGKKEIMNNAGVPNDTFNGWSYFIGADTARSGKASADYTVVTVLAYHAKLNKKKIAYMWRTKGHKITDQVQKVADISMAFGHPPMLVEVNNMGQEFIDQLIDNHGLNVEGFTTSRFNKEELIRLLIVEFEQGNIIIPNGDDNSKAQSELILTELSRFIVEVTRAGNEVMKGAGKSKDDIVMSLAFANKCAHSMGYEPYVSAVPRKDKSDLEMFTLTNDPMEYLRL